MGINIEAPVQTLSTGDVDGDGQNEVVLGTGFGRSSGGIFLIDNNQPVWDVSVGLWVNNIAVWEKRPAKSAQQVGSHIIAAVNSTDNSNTVLLLNNKGEKLWQRKFDDAVLAVAGDGKNMLVGTEIGQVYRLNADGEQLGAYNLGVKILSLEADLAATANGQIYQLSGDTPTLIHDFGETLTAVQLGEALAAGFEGGVSA